MGGVTSIVVLTAGAGKCRTPKYPLECPCAISFLAMAKPASLHGQTEPCPCTKQGFGVIMVVFLRQFMTVLASIIPSIDANMQGWPQGEKSLATGGIRLATGGFKVGHRTDRSLTGIGRDLGTPRKEFDPRPKRFGAVALVGEERDDVAASTLQSCIGLPGIPVSIHCRRAQWGRARVRVPAPAA